MKTPYLNEEIERLKSFKSPITEHVEQLKEFKAIKKALSIQNVRDLLLDFGSYYEDDKTSIAVDEVVDNYLNQKQ